jgi:hypothetical protein
MSTINDTINYFNNLPPFKCVDDIPDIPFFKDRELYINVIVKNLIRCGAIPKKDLKIGKTYQGSCRNTNKAIWNGTEFEYERYKFGYLYEDAVNHFEDDDGYDVFVPLKEDF